MFRRFKTKRQRRKQRLLKLPPEKWGDLPESLKVKADLVLPAVEPGNPCPIPMVGKWIAKMAEDDTEYRVRLAETLSMLAERNPDYAYDLDRFVGLRTDDEDKEYDQHWATRRNKGHYLISWASLCISMVAIGIAAKSCEIQAVKKVTNDQVTPARISNEKTP